MSVINKINHAMEACRRLDEDLWSIDASRWAERMHPDLVEEIKLHIEALELKVMHADTEQAQHPVAWRIKRFSPEIGEYFEYVEMLTDLPARYGWEPLYAQLATPAAQPLSDEQLKQMRLDARESNRVVLEHWWIIFARAIEAAHGITLEQQA